MHVDARWLGLALGADAALDGVRVSRVLKLAELILDACIARPREKVVALGGAHKEELVGHRLLEGCLARGELDNGSVRRAAERFRLLALGDILAGVVAVRSAEVELNGHLGKVAVAAIKA